MFLKRLLQLEDFLKMEWVSYTIVDNGNSILVELFYLLIGQVVVRPCGKLVKEVILETLRF